MTNESTTTTAIESKCQQEIIRLHEFFVDWFSGSLPNTPKNFQQHFLQCMSSDFHLLSPRGVIDDLSNLTTSLRQAYGMHKDKKNFTIDIQNCLILFAEDGHYLVQYEEWQKTMELKTTKTEEGGEVDDDTLVVGTTSRISTVLLREKKGSENDTLNGLEWIHVHETWLLETSRNHIASQMRIIACMYNKLRSFFKQFRANYQRQITSTPDSSSPSSLLTTVTTATSTATATSTSTSTLTSIESKCQQEVNRLHHFFVDWFTGSIPNTNEIFRPHFLRSMSSNFHMISPRGVVDDLTNLTASLREAYGMHKDKKNFTIEIQNCKILFAEGGHYFVRYEELQKTTPLMTEGGVVDDDDDSNDKVAVGTTTRISTALFREKPDENDTSNSGLEWIHVHETWLPDTTPTGSNRT